MHLLDTVEEVHIRLSIFLFSNHLCQNIIYSVIDIVFISVWMSVCPLLLYLKNYSVFLNQFLEFMY